MTRLEVNVRALLSHWGPWMVVAYVGLVGVVVYGYTLNARTLRDEAIREAESMSAKDSAVARCLASRPILARFSTHVKGVNDLSHAIVQNSAAIIRTTPTSDPQYRVRVANLKRLVRANDKITAIDRLAVPTVAECRRGP